jgi:formylmethanofuran dehydrogenase subunit D
MHKSVEMFNFVHGDSGVNIKSAESFKDLLVKNGAEEATVTDEGFIYIPKTINIGGIMDGRTIRYGMPDVHAIRKTYKIGEDQGERKQTAGK